MTAKLLSLSFGAVVCAAMLIGHPTTTRAQDLSCGGAGSTTSPIGGPGGGAVPECAFATYDANNLYLGVTFTAGTFSPTLTNVEFILTPGAATYLVTAGSSFEGTTAPAFEFMPSFIFTGDGMVDYYSNGLEAIVPLADIGGNGALDFTLDTDTELALDSDEYSPLEYEFGDGTSASAGSTTSVPEPASLVLFASGLATLTALRRRARKALS
jgi:hypothetical protein